MHQKGADGRGCALVVGAVLCLASLAKDLPTRFDFHDESLIQKYDARDITSGAFENLFLTFSGLSAAERDSQAFADYLEHAYRLAEKKHLLTDRLIRRFGSLIAGDSFDPNAKGFGRYSRYTLENIRDTATKKQQHALDEGVREQMMRQLARSPHRTPREAIQKLVASMPDWSNEKFTRRADYFFGTPYIDSWELAMDSLAVLFLLKAREVSPEARSISDHFVGRWLETLNHPELAKPIHGGLTDEEREYLKAGLAKANAPDILDKIDQGADRTENRHHDGVIDSSPIIYVHQYRNLILKEILRSFDLSPHESAVVKDRLEKNETELTDMLARFKKGEETTDEITGFNLYALETTVLAARDGSQGLAAMRHYSNRHPRYHVDSEFPADARAAAPRAPGYRLAELAHSLTPEERAVAVQKLKRASTDFMEHLPSLVVHARGWGMHWGESQWAPYFFFFFEPFAAVAQRLLMQEKSLTPAERHHFRKERAFFARVMTMLQKDDGTFALLAVSGNDEGGKAYPSCAAWVNTLKGLTLLSLIDDAESPSTQFGIVDPDRLR
ncbi:MAG: hypothetical protein HYR96_02925 [Deltaproteobacteria bacterium]|nr:hypothetical protein [Deltaproteobacteria bacterium]